MRQVVERAQGLLERGVHVVSVGLEQVEMVGIQPPKRRSPGFEDVFCA